MNEITRKDKIKQILSTEIKFDDVVKGLFGDKIKTIILCIIMLSFPILELYSEIIGRTYQLQQPILQFIGIALFIYLCIDFLRKKHHMLVVSDLIIVLSILFVIISIVFSIDPYFSLTGYELYTDEDCLQVFGYFMVFMMATSIEDIRHKKKIIFMFVGVAVLHTIPAFMQRFDIWSYESFRPREVAGAYGLTQHYNCYAALAVMFSALATVLFVAKKTKYRYIWYMVAIAFFVASMYSWCRIAWVGILVYMLFIPVFEIYQKKKNLESNIDIHCYFMMFLSFVLLFVLMAFFDKSVSSQFVETSQEVSGNSTGIGNNRMHIWSVGLYAVKDHLITGLGFDNYRRAFWLYPEWDRIWYAYKGHNEYIHILVTQGVFSAINYIVLCVYSFFFGIKQYLNDEKNNKCRWVIYILLCMIIAYFSQAFFNDSECNVAVYKWMIMGLLLPRSRQKILCKSREKEMA